MVISSRHLRIPARFLTAALLCVLIAPVAHAQSPADLRRENDQLRERIAELEAQLETQREETEKVRASYESRLDTAQAEIRRLQNIILQLRGEDRRVEDPTKPDRPTDPLPDDALACPDCLFEALRTDYENAFADMPRSNRSETERYIREVAMWSNRMEREYRGAVEWIVRIDEIKEPEMGARDVEVTVSVLNPETGNAWGDPVTLEMPGRYARRLMDSPDQERWNLRAAITAEPKVNREREEEGALPVPRFIGPYAEFGYELRPQSIVPAR